MTLHVRRAPPATPQGALRGGSGPCAARSAARAAVCVPAHLPGRAAAVQGPQARRGRPRPSSPVAPAWQRADHALQCSVRGLSDSELDELAGALDEQVEANIGMVSARAPGQRGGRRGAAGADARPRRRR